MKVQDFGDSPGFHRIVFPIAILLQPSEACAISVFQPQSIRALSRPQHIATE